MTVTLAILTITKTAHYWTIISFDVEIAVTIPASYRPAFTGTHAHVGSFFSIVYAGSCNNMAECDNFEGFEVFSNNIKTI